VLNKPNPIMSVAVLIALASTVTNGQATGHAFSEVTLDTAQGALPTQLAAAVQKASQKGLTPVVDLGASWCEPCHLVDDVIHQPAMQSVMQKMYVIHLDFDVWQSPLGAMGADVNTGIQRVFAIDHTGRPAGEPWRPRDIPDSLNQKGDEEGFRLSLMAYFAKAQATFAAAQAPPPPAKPPAH
jgi:thiol-disulfide isomerase/thioredoxin